MKSQIRKCSESGFLNVVMHITRQLLCLILVISWPVYAEDLIVLAARDSVLQPGDVVKSDVILSLRTGQSLTLIAKNGKVIRLQGDYRGQPLRNSGENTEELTDALKSLVLSGLASATPEGTQNKHTITGKTGANISKIPEPWLIDVTDGGNQCVQNGRPIRLWRRESNETVLELITNTGNKISTKWPKGEKVIAMPHTLPITDGDNYTLTLGSERHSSTWHVIPDSVNNINVIASWMLEKGCNAQAIALVAASSLYLL